MADTKLADLTALTTPSGDDILYIVDDPAGTPLDRKIALDNLFTRGTITADAPVINVSQTWNNGAVTFTGLKFNATDTASAAASLLLDIGTGGGTYASKFSVRKNGRVTGTNFFIDPVWDTGLTGSFTTPQITAQGNTIIVFNNASIKVQSNCDFSFASGTNPAITSPDTILSRRAAANLRLGAADTTGTTAPTPQFLSAQSWASSTTDNQTGANFTIDGSQGTGTGAGGSIIFRVAPAGAISNGVQNALAAALTITSGQRVQAATWIDAVNGLVVGGASPDVIIGSAASYGVTLRNTAPLAWTSSDASATQDVFLRRDAANTLALRNGTNAQTFRVYNTTDGTNSEYGFMKWNGTTFEIGAEQSGTGSNRNVTIRSNSGVITFNDGNSAAQMTSGQFNFGTRSLSQVINVEMSGYTQMSEMTAPAAPAANGVRIYAVDNGSGKTQLMALFASGVAQQIAIQP